MFHRWRFDLTDAVQEIKSQQNSEGAEPGRIIARFFCCKSPTAALSVRPGSPWDTSQVAPKVCIWNLLSLHQALWQNVDNGRYP